MIIALSVALVFMFFVLLGALAHIGKLQKQLIDIDKEQHTQNTDIIDLIKFKGEATQMLLQHIEILQYLVDKDDLLGKKKIYYKGPMGEA
jgi:hypothetical protein